MTRSTRNIASIDLTLEAHTQEPMIVSIANQSKLEYLAKSEESFVLEAVNQAFLKLENTNICSVRALQPSTKYSTCFAILLQSQNQDPIC